jgi:hypothetical protein
MEQVSVLMDNIYAEKQEKKERAAQRKQEREENGIENKLVVERDNTGLFYLRYELGGPVPDALRGKFTTLKTIQDAVIGKFGNTNKLKL